MAMPELLPPDPMDRAAVIGEPALRARLVRFVRTRVPEAEAEDVVQTTLTDALAAANAPATRDELERWVHGIAKNKIADYYRKTRREVPHDGQLEEQVTAESAPQSARDLMRWAEQELPGTEGADSTLEWMLREADGEKLEHIAAEESLPAPRVRQRVTRLRKHYRQRWAAQLAAVAALVVLAFAAMALWKHRSSPEREDIAREVTPEVERARALRRAGLDDCDHAHWKPCVDKLDQARALDPAGDSAPRVMDARKAAANALSKPDELPKSITPDLAPSAAPVQSAPAPKAAPRPRPYSGSIDPGKPAAKPEPWGSDSKSEPKKASKTSAPAPQPTDDVPAVPQMQNNAK